MTDHPPPPADRPEGIPPGFELLSRRELTEFRAVGLHVRHRKTGCEIFHLHRDDRDNLFAFAFKTPPADNTGVAHILEHSVLCGSRRFPARDPFLQLLKGSMNTFMNAFTFPDKTVYPASSQVEQDFYNLFRVYGDAVFFPLLRREAFMQEGQRREFGEDGRLRAVGIVYNEMKGNYSSHESIASEWAIRSLFSDSPYGFDSGGEPEAILNLRYEDFTAFHAAFYHPSNCRVFLYGDIPTEKHLRFLEENVLSFFDSRPRTPEIPPAARWDRPRRLEKTYPAQEGESAATGSSITLNWLLPPVTDPMAALSFEILAEILLGNAGSPLRKALVESGLGEDLSAPTGLETETLEMVFSVGLRGIPPRKRKALEDLVEKTLEDLRDGGLDRERVEGAVRRVEFRNREVRAGSAFGLRLMRRSLRGWLHGQGPERTLEFAPVMAGLREEIARDPRRFENLIRRQLLENPHRSTLVVKPDPALAAREEARTRERLDREEARLSERDREELRRDLDAFRAFQDSPDSPEALASIPALALADIPRELETIPVEILPPGGAAGLYAHDLYTNGIVYADFAFELEGGGPPDLFLPLFTAALTGIGAGGRPYDRIALELALKTGGLGTELEAGTVVGGGVRRFLFLRLKSLEDNFPEALDLLRDILLRPDLEDERRLRDIFLEFRNDLKGSIIPGGHAFASSRAERGLSPAEAVEEKWKGISQYRFVAGLPEGRAGRLVAENCRRIRGSALTRRGLTANFSAPAASWPRILRDIQAFAEAFPQDPAPGFSAGTAPEAAETIPPLEGLAVPSAVAFVATAVPAAVLGGKEHAHEAVLAHLLGTGYLWEKIRMKGGAYGAFCSAHGRDGVLTFASYRDPNIASTLAAFRDALEGIARDGVDPESAKNAVIGAVARDMKPLSPGGKSIVAFRRALYGLTDELRARHRLYALETGVEDLRAAAGRLLSGFGSGFSAVIAGRPALEDAASALPGLAGATTEVLR